jgi:pimeloyl-ACP methyl ester carboxylesterase
MQGHRRFREHKINVVSASAHACLRPSFIIQHESSNMDMGRQLSRSQDIATKVSLLLQKRLKVAQDHYTEEIQRVYGNDAGGSPWTNPAAAANAWSDWYAYMVDSAQRSILFWDTIRQRGNNFIDHTREGLPPVLQFEYETVLDGRKFARPVNYALLKIVPPKGVTVDAERRPYVIIDPRAGHGPGIGGMKDDSQVGVALREGHPVYFVIFFRDPEPGQTLLDVCESEKQFVKKVRALHPRSPKPAIVGNCQGGWAAMMLAAADPDDTGPIVINGAPMSYWGGAWQEGGGDNPMRYSGGMLGGTWLASLTSDLGNGVFDGAHLVENFENLNPANTFWDKYYHLYANVDTEPPRFLEFERWWGGFYLMNKEEIEWITRNLFVGNKLWSGETKAKGGMAFDLKRIKAPIILFASMGDNITPPQQAFNWVADVYGSTDEIKARGQVIVGLMHQEVGHLGIFVSGKVARKEHTQIVSVLKSIEALPPGLYAMKIHETKKADGKVEYHVDFTERSLEEITAKLNRFQRADEEPFEAVNAISDFNQRAYELFAQPLVQSMSNEFTAKLRRQFHPLRFQRWAMSDMNPWLAWLGPAAKAVREQRASANKDNAMLKVEKAASTAISASLEYYRGVRDAVSEATFFQTYGNVFSLYVADKRAAEDKEAQRVLEARDLPFVAEALASIDKGGYPEALARVACLLARKGEPLLLSWLETKQELISEYRDLLPSTAPDEWRRIRGEQEIVVRYEPERALATLPKLLANPADRERLVTLVRRLLMDERVQRSEPSNEQLAMVEHIGEALHVAGASRVRNLSKVKAPKRPSREPSNKRKR